MAQPSMSALEMVRAEADTGNFRDLAARVHAVADRMVRGIPEARLAEFKEIQAHSTVAALVEQGALIGSTFVPPLSTARGTFAAYVEHPAIEFVSYPYEWPFAALKAAALHYLDLQLTLLPQGITVASASAYDVQFQGVRPVLMNPTALIMSNNQERWPAYAQFCREFLYPLLLTSTTGLAFQLWYRGAGSGLDARSLLALMPSWVRLDPRIRKHVLGPLRGKDEGGQLPRVGLPKFLRGLRDWIARLEPKGRQAVETSAPADVPSANAEIAKFEVVRDFVARVRPGMLLDLSCGGGDYSALALRSGAAAAVGVERDPQAADAAFRRAERTRRDMLVLTMDVTEPSPGQGFPSGTRKSFEERACFDGLLGLRILSHFMDRGVPLEHCVPWLVRLAPAGVIEFAPPAKTDSAPADPPYTEEVFSELMAGHARIVRRETVSNLGHTLYLYDRR